MDLTNVPEALQAQDKLVAKLDAEGWNIVVGEMFIRGIRDIGYKSVSYALAELVDNAIQASASHIDIVFGFDSGEKPTRIAVVDDGHGMRPKMVRASLVLGAGTRADDRTGYGKYGYGLKSASVSQCRRVSVYSKTVESSWHTCYLDVDEISSGEWTHKNRVEMPEEKPASLPGYVATYLKQVKRPEGFDHGSVVVWEKLDRLSPRQRATLRDRIVTDLGVIYRNVLVNVPMTVDAVPVQPCDPLFLTPGFRGYDTDEDRAVAVPSAVFDVADKETGKVMGKLRVRFSRFPATFFRVPEAKRTNKPGRNQTNERLGIAAANDGIIFTRNGRQIDAIRPPRNIGTINVSTDRYWGVEVDFDATLDELFAITTTKQHVVPDDRIWDMLRDKANVFKAIGTMRTTYQKEADTIAAAAEVDKEQKRASVLAIEQATKFRTTKPPQETPERTKEAAENLQQETRRRAEQSGLKPEVVEREIVAQQEGNPRDVRTEDLPGAPFFRCTQLGGQRVLFLNVAHPFYGELYSGPGSTPRLRAGLEIVLWALGEAEVDADPGGDKRRFYELERAAVWSPYVAAALPILKDLPLMQEEVADRSTAA
jgi:hypothetical protein